jgi:PAS domain S-box-containing protein
MDIFRQKKKNSSEVINSIPLAFASFKIDFDTSGLPVNLTFLDINDIFESIAGIGRNEMIGKKLTEVFPELKSTLPHKFKTYAAKLNHLTTFEYETYIETRRKWYDVHVNVPDHNSLIILLSECTIRKSIEEELKESEFKFKNLYENSPVGLYRVSPEGNILMANNTLVKILGLSSVDELLKFDPKKSVNSFGKDGSGLKKSIETKGKINGNEASWTTKNGNIIYVRESAKEIHDKNGNIIYFEKTVEDITERKIAEMQIAELNHFFLEMGVDPKKNIHTIVKKTNEILKGFCSLYNRIDEKEKSLITWSEHNAPLDIKRTDKSEGHICYEATFKARHNPVIIEELNSTSFYQSDPNVIKYGLRSYLGMPVVVEGKTIGTLCVMYNKPRKFTDSDVNTIKTLAKTLSLEQKRYFSEEKLRNAIEEARQANLSKSQFLANMSHEIRTPLNGIIGFSEMLSSQEADERKVRILKMIEDSGYQLLQIINDIFDYSRIEAGKITLHPESFKLDEIINETVGYFDKAAKEKGLSLIVEFENLKENELFGDGFKFKQILINVLSNAIKFTDEGLVLVLVSSEKAGKVVQVKVTIEDTGIGINKDQLERIFDEFKQLEYYLTKRIKGTGLGLTITKKLLDLLDGNVTVESEQGKGSRFTISIPFQSELIPETKIQEVMNKPENKKETVTKKIKILLAEDNEANQFLIKAITRSQEWDITIVDNGEKAVEQYKTGAFDIILMDVQMPVMNGYEATKIIRQIESEKGIHTPIIALTAYAMKADKDVCIESGMDDYISKPFKRQQFLDSIIDVLKRIG